MPVIVREGSWRIKIFTADHEPPHVHVVHQGGMATVRLDADYDVLEVHRMTRRDMLTAVRLVEAHREIPMEAWRRIHGNSQPD